MKMWSHWPFNPKNYLCISFFPTNGVPADYNASICFEDFYQQRSLCLYGSSHILAWCYLTQNPIDFNFVYFQLLLLTPHSLLTSPHTPTSCAIVFMSHVSFTQISAWPNSNDFFQHLWHKTSMNKLCVTKKRSWLELKLSWHWLVITLYHYKKLCWHICLLLNKATLIWNLINLLVH